MSEPILTVRVEDEPTRTFADYVDLARERRACFFKPEVPGPSFAFFNFAQDRIEFKPLVLHAYAYGEIKDGDPLAKSWDAAGWQALGARVAWRFTPFALLFSLSSGHRYQLRRAALREWMDGSDDFPQLERIRTGKE